MQAIAFALLTVLGMTAFTLVLRTTLVVWPVGLAGSLSRVITLAVLGAWVLATGAGWHRLRPRGTGLWLALMCLLSNGINLLMFAALKWTTATNHALLFRLDLVFVVLIGGVLGLERVGRRQLLLVPWFLLGMALVTEIGRFDLGGHLAGDLMVLGAAIGFATNAFVIRRILQAMDEAAVALYNHGISTVGFLLLVVVNDEWSVVADRMHAPMAWFWIGLLGWIVAISLPLYYAALRCMAVWRLRAWLLLVPVLVAVADWLLWGTMMSPSQCCGAAIILAGLFALVRIELADTARKRAVARAIDEPRPVVATAAADECDPKDSEGKDHAI